MSRVLGMYTMKNGMNEKATVHLKREIPDGLSQDGEETQAGEGKGKGQIVKDRGS